MRVHFLQSKPYCLTWRTAVLAREQIECRQTFQTDLSFVPRNNNKTIHPPAVKRPIRPCLLSSIDAFRVKRKQKHASPFLRAAKVIEDLSPEVSS